MAKHYENGTRISVGDNVLYGGKAGQIVFLIEEGKFLVGYESSDWSYRKNGIGVRLTDGTLFCLDDPDEDLIPV